MPPPFCGLHDDDQPAVANAPKSVTRSFYLWYGTNERLGIAGYGPVRG